MEPKATVRRGCTVIMHANELEGRRENIWFIHILRKLLEIRSQIGEQERIDRKQFDHEFSKWISSSQVTLVVLTASFGDASVWKDTFNTGRFTYDARQKAKECFIPVMMPQFPSERLDLMFGTHMVTAHTPFKFKDGWQNNQEDWSQLARTIRNVAGVKHRMQINLVELNPSMAYAIRNRTLPGKDISLRGSLLLAFCRQQKTVVILQSSSACHV